MLTTYAEICLVFLINDSFAATQYSRDLENPWWRILVYLKNLYYALHMFYL